MRRLSISIRLRVFLSMLLVVAKLLIVIWYWLLCIIRRVFIRGFGSCRSLLLIWRRLPSILAFILWIRVLFKRTSWRLLKISRINLKFAATSVATFSLFLITFNFVQLVLRLKIILMHWTQLKRLLAYSKTFVKN